MGVKGPDLVLHLRPIAAAAAALLLFSLAPLTCLVAYTPPDNYLIDCGSTTNTTVNGRTFSADVPPASWTLSAPQSHLVNTTSNLSFDSAALHSTARVFPSASSYSFPIKQQGRHFIRLYFYPIPQPSHNLTSAEFSVATQAYTLLSSYRAAAAAVRSGAVVFKEYLVNVTSNTLVLSFTPAANSTAFVNAIEVISVPDSLISGTPKTLGTVGVFQGLQGTALETVHRINMGGPMVSPFDDSLWRAWIPDGPFLLNRNLAKNFNSTTKINYIQGGATAETAPPMVYSSLTMMSISMVTNANFNVTWDFPVDPGSAYLVRLHFCDIVSTALNQLLFNVYVGNLSAANLDLSYATNQNLAAPYFLDVVAGNGLVNSGKLRVSIGPDALANVEPNAILNGLEIMKMNASGGTFDAQLAGGKKKKAVAAVIGAALGGAVVAGVLAAAVMVVLRRRRKMALEAEKKRQQLRQQPTSNWTPLSASAVASSSAFHTYATGYTNRTNVGPTSRVASALHTDRVGLRFAFVVLQEATANFDEARVIGVGGFGKVYSGALEDGTRVAVKRGNPKSQQGLREFRTEIDLLSQLRHRHLVSLIGYCDEHNEMVLVYEFMEQGTLKSHLYGDPSPPPLSWKQRLEICIGAARGLHYLHTGQAKAIIHRDVKSANILLDEHLNAKVADFGLSKTGPDLDQSHVSTAVKGSFGYLDPEYFRRQQLTEKSDVYSFGVVLYEVICARPVIDPTRPRETVNLAEWAVRLQKQGKLEQIVDPAIAGTIRPESLHKFSTTAEKCLAECGVDRPSMGDVLWNLEYALQLQEALSVADERSAEESSSGNEVPLLLSTRFRGVGRSAELEIGSVVAERGSNTEGEQEQDELGSETMSKVFSELVRSDGK